MARETELGAFEMLWDCRNCGTTKLLGVTHRFCPNCGSPQNPVWRYFPADEDKVAVENHPYSGTDLICPACDVPNSRNAKHCVACGAELVKARDAAVRTDQVVGEGEAFRGEAAKDAKADHDAQRAQKDAPPPPKVVKKALVIGGCVALAIALLMVVFLWKREALVTVTGHRWEREIDIEAFGPQSDSSWCNEMPGGAYRVSRSREIRSHKKIPDGETCRTRRKDNGDGTYSEVQECETKYRDEPVYDDRCRYLIDRWQRERTLRAVGTSLSQEPKWPPVTLARTGLCIGCEREGAHHEIYEVDLRREDKGNKQSRCAFPQARWSEIPDGTQWRMNFAVVTGLPDCASLKPPK